MYTNPSCIIKTLKALLDRNSQQINKVVREYVGDKRSLMVLEGMRKVVPADAYPVMEIEPEAAPNRWATTRAQRPKFNFRCVITVKVDREEFGVEYICALTAVVVEIMTNPQNLQMKILGEQKWSPDGSLGDTYILDSLVDSVNYSQAKEGAIRKAEFSWFAEVHEPFPATQWKVGGTTTPTVTRPKVVPS